MTTDLLLLLEEAPWSVAVLCLASRLCRGACFSELSEIIRVNETLRLALAGQAVFLDLRRSFPPPHWIGRIRFTLHALTLRGRVDRFTVLKLLWTLAAFCLTFSLCHEACFLVQPEKVLLSLAIAGLLLALCEGACFSEKLSHKAKGCVDKYDGSKHPFGSTWNTAKCMQCRCARYEMTCCTRYGGVVHVPGCTAVVDPKTCTSCTKLAILPSHVKKRRNTLYFHSHHGMRTEVNRIAAQHLCVAGILIQRS
ncbi:uncharacterized protein LOC123027158 [Varanus komodoensis]|uniref:uncharacterized protein LOC123027158 n=1 Tax=Varanus komodoensis TaxID=61221 RepID=UPI001CF7A890|nr:uncharacterized protein LOC123027158 [Varanus komodoensis]